MPGDPRPLGAGSPRDGVDLVPGRYERGERMAPDEAARARDKEAAHGRKSGYVASRSLIVRPPAGDAGQSMPNAGSSQRTPRAASGT